MIIAHDLGTSGNKATIHTDDAEIIQAAEVSYPVAYGSQGEAEQNPLDWWNAVVVATRKLLQYTDPKSVEAVCVSGQMMGLVALDCHYQPLRSALIWSDQRATQESEYLNNCLGSQYLYTLTGHRIGPTYNVAKLLWIQKHEPENFQKLAYTCVAKDYINYRLTGKIVTDHTDASSTGMYDLQQKQWCAEILQAAKLDPKILPPILESTEIIGTLTKAAALELGLQENTKVVVGGGDGAIAAVGAGCVAPKDKIYGCLGTSAWFSKTSLAPLLDEQQRSFTFSHIASGLYLPTATTQNGSGVLPWIANILEPTQGASALDRLISEAKEVKTDVPLFLPYLLGERSPWWTAHSRGTWLGLNQQHTRAHLVRSAIEGVAQNLSLCLDVIAQDQDLSQDGITVIGGGARNDILLQIYADVWGVPVYRKKVTNSANSLGAAVTALYALGKADLSISNNVAEVEKIFLPGSEHERYLEQRQRFISAFAQVEPWDRENFSK